MEKEKYARTIEINYFPPQSYFHLLKDQNLLIEAHENYQKRSFRNKCIILGSNGTQLLTIPLQKGKHERQKIKDVKIGYNENWPHQHIQSIRSAYGSAPYFDYYFPLLEKLLNLKPIYLFEFNCMIIEQLINCLQWDQTLRLTSEYRKVMPPDQDYRDTITPSNYQQVVETSTYPQVFSDRFAFIPKLIIIDALFCIGPATGLYLGDLSIIT